jgi:hypothetical protein
MTLDLGAVAKEMGAKIWSEGRTTDLTSEIERQLPMHGFALEDSSVLDSFDRLKDRVSLILKDKIEQSKQKGLLPRLSQSSIDPDQFIANSTASLDETRLKLANALEKLSWREMEHLFAHLLRVNGIEKCLPMRGTKEEGIDIFGEWDLGRSMQSTTWHQVHLRVLAQVKKGVVSQPDVRLFNQDMGSFMRGEGNAHRLAPTWFKESHWPMLGFMFAGGGFTRGAKSWAARHGIIAKDSEQVVEDLLSKPEKTPGIRRAGQGVVFELASFNNFINHLQKMS